MGAQSKNKKSKAILAAGIIESWTYSLTRVFVTWDSSTFWAAKNCSSKKVQSQRISEKKLEFVLPIVVDWVVLFWELMLLCYSSPIILTPSKKSSGRLDDLIMEGWRLGNLSKIVAFATFDEDKLSDIEGEQKSVEELTKLPS